MSMTRAQLDAAILAYLEDTNSAESQAMVGSWVALAEADIRQRLRAPWMIRVAPAVPVEDAAAPFRLPDSFVGAVAAYVVQDSYAAEVEFLASSQLAPYIHRTGSPRFLVIEGHWAQLLPGSGPASLRLTYYSLGKDLSESDAKNENLAHAPNVYLYGALVHAALYKGDDAAASRFRGVFDTLVEEINGIGISWNAGSGFRRRR